VTPGPLRVLFERAVASLRVESCHVNGFTLSPRSYDALKAELPDDAENDGALFLLTCNGMTRIDKGDR
jgi:hypothetical protein